MKKRILNIILILLAGFMICPTAVLAEDLTYGNLLDELAEAKKQLEKNQQEIDDQKGQIVEDNATIKKLENDIQSMSDETVELQQGIANANIEIENKKEQTKDLVSYLQMSQGENIYLDYVFGGESITDLIYRLSIVEQITEYNAQMVEELENLITANENRKVQLANKQTEYKEKMEELDKEIQKLNNSINQSKSLSPSFEQQVKDKQNAVDYYKSLGCKNRSDVIGRDCAVTINNAIFVKPIQMGYITSFIGYRWGELHKGLDMGSSLGRNTPIYSIGKGVIKSVYEDYYHAKCIRVQYKVNGQYYTAIYAHLSRYAPGIYLGMKNKEIDENTLLGYMGDTGHAYGVHLHLEVWPCRLYEDSNCSTWDTYSRFVERQFNNGFKGAESVISFPSRTYQTWYNR